MTPVTLHLYCQVCGKRGIVAAETVEALPIAVHAAGWAELESRPGQYVCGRPECRKTGEET